MFHQNFGGGFGNDDMGPGRNGFLDFVFWNFKIFFLFSIHKIFEFLEFLEFPNFYFEMNPRDFDEIYEVPSRETMSWLNAGLGLSSKVWRISKRFQVAYLNIPIG